MVSYGSEFLKDIDLYYKNVVSHNLKVKTPANERLFMFMPLVRHCDPFRDRKQINTVATFKCMVSASLSNRLF